jgi:FHS family Na+ dependent glucose MFS transporter 1
MQAMHFAFAVGGIISPLATAPFLADEYSHITTLNSSYPTVSHELILTTEGSELKTSHYEVRNNSQPFVSTLTRNSESLELFIPYTMSGLLAFSSSVLFLVVYIKSRKFRKKIEIRTEIERNERKLTAITKIVVLSILSIIFLLYTAIEDTVGAYVATFCVKQMKMSKQQASYVTALFWTLFAFGRLSGILIGTVVRSIPLVGIYSVLLMLSFLLLSFASSFDSQVIVWVSTAMTGFAMSILFPTLFTWTEEDFLLVTGKIASLFIMTSTAGSIASPAALGYLIEEVSPMWYAYILLGESIGVTFFFAIAALLKKRLPQLQDQRQREITTVDLVSSVTESNPEQSVLINNRDNNKSL